MFLKHNVLIHFCVILFLNFVQNHVFMQFHNVPGIPLLQESSENSYFFTDLRPEWQIAFQSQTSQEENSPKSKHRPPTSILSTTKNAYTYHLFLKNAFYMYLATNCYRQRRPLRAYPSICPPRGGQLRNLS